VPAALSCLSRLQLCHLDRSRESGTVGQGSALPSGPWLRSLRWLSTDIGVLLRGTQALHAAAALENVSINSLDLNAGLGEWDAPAAAAFFAWLAPPPPLRQLSMCSPCSPNLVVSGGFLLQFAQLFRRRPSLLLHCPNSSSEGQTLFEHLGACHPF